MAFFLEQGLQAFAENGGIRRPEQEAVDGGGYGDFHAQQGRRVMVWVAAAAGSLTYVVLYGLKNILMGHFVQGFTWAAAIGETMTLKVPVSVGNGIIAVICAALLAMALAPSLHKAHLLEQ